MVHDETYHAFVAGIAQFVAATDARTLKRAEINHTQPSLINRMRTRAAAHQAVLQDGAASENFWVFGYGSLMWRPGFAYGEEQPARLAGFRRDMCFLSVHYRGTPSHPGLVCGLVPEPAAVCHGRAFRIAPADVRAVVDYLDARELITDIYRPEYRAVVLADGRAVTALVYVADTAHAQFVGPWSGGAKAALIASATGSEGASLDYLNQLVAHLEALGIRDDGLRALLHEARALAATPSVSG